MSDIPQPHEGIPGNQAITSPLALEAKELTEQFIKHFYQGDTGWCLERCHPSITYLGSTQEGLALDKEGLRTIMTTVLSSFNPSLPLSIDSTAIMLPGETSVLTLTRFALISDPATGQVRASKKRSTMLWELTEDGLRLRHTHFSTPSFAGSDRESMADIPRQTYLYAKAMIDQVAQRTGATVRDTTGTLHHLSPIEVRFVEASRQRTIIHCLDKDVVVRKGFKETVAPFGKDLMTVHRSFAVNPGYVHLVFPDVVVMDDDTHIPLPQRHSREVRARLEAAMRTTLFIPQLQ